MSYNESAYKQLLMGVSQQDPSQRLEGQLTAQQNMVSDLVYGLRRRPPLARDGAIEQSGWERDNIAIYNTRISGTLTYLIVQTDTGSIWAVTPAGGIIWQTTVPYLVASTRAAIRFASVSDVVYIANVEKVPTEETPSDVEDYPDPAYLGYWYGVATAYSKTFDCTITRQDTGAQITASYTTPQGSDATQVSQATLSYVATQLADSLKEQWTDITVTTSGGYIGIKSTAYPISVTTSSGSTYARASGNHQVSLVDNLPSLVPGIDNFTMTVGTGTTATYYRYVAATAEWEEDAAYGAIKAPTNMPVRVYYDAEWKLETPAYERRASGNLDTNPSPHFVDVGITGIAAFQGRLVILSNEYVCMSGTNNPLRWYRSSTESLLPNDPLEAAGSDGSSSAYVHAVVFNKDLVCFGADTQAVVPGTQPVTPSNVVLAVMSKYRSTLYAPPLSTGRSLYVGATRGGGNAAVWEFLPSDYVSSQILGNDVTSHIPSYMTGTIELLTASTTSGVMVVGYSGDRATLVVEEYNWAGAEKRQSAWHKWTMPGDVLHAVFEGDLLYIMMNAGGHVVLGHIDLRASGGTTALTQPKLDNFMTLTATTADRLSCTSVYWQEVGEELKAFKTSGDGAYLQQTMTKLSDDGTTVTFKVVGAEEGDTYIAGKPYLSSFELTPPQLLDSNGSAITMHRSIIQRYHVSWANTGVYQYQFQDAYRDQGEQECAPISFASPELELGSPLVATNRNILPARLDMRTVRARFSTSDVYDLNPVTIEYGYRYSQGKGRRI